MYKIYNLEQIETPRLIIRPLHLGDEQGLYQAIVNSLPLLQQWMPWAHASSAENTRNFVQQAVFGKMSAMAKDCPMVAIHKQDQKIIIGTGYNDKSSFEDGIYEIGYWCDVDYQGQGYITECALALTRYALEYLEAKFVIIQMDVDNLKSKAVPQRLGFEDLGVQPTETNQVFVCKKTENLPFLNYHYTEKTHHFPEIFKLLNWAKNTLEIQEDDSFRKSRVIVQTPWSLVIALEVQGNIVYLKQMPQKIALEPYIFNLAKNHFDAPVPKILAINEELSAFLMEEAGSSLRSQLKQNLNYTLIFQALHEVTAFQIKTSHHIQILQDLGIPNWSLKNISHLYCQDLMLRDSCLIQDLNQSQMDSLHRRLSPQIVSDRQCSYGIFFTRWRLTSRTLF